MTPKHFVYVLKTSEATPRYYVGITCDVPQRLIWHNEGHCTHTAKYRPWGAHVVIEFSDPLTGRVRHGEVTNAARRQPRLVSERFVETPPDLRTSISRRRYDREHDDPRWLHGKARRRTARLASC